MSRPFKRKGTDTWYIRVTYNGKRITRAVGKDFRRAVATLRKQEKDIADANAANIPWAGQAKMQRSRMQPTFAEVADRFIETRIETGRMKPSTLRTYRNHLDSYLLPFFGQTKVSQISEESIRCFQTSLSKGNAGSKRSNRRVNNIVNLLRTILKQCLQDELIADNPAFRVERLREKSTDIDPLTPQELAAALDNIPPTYKALFKLLAYTGMRPNEALALRWSDIDWHRHQISISKGRVRGAVSKDGCLQIGFVEGEPKTRKSKRVIQIHPELEPELLQLHSQESLPDPSKHVFTNRSGNPISSHLNVIWKKALQQAGVKHRPSYQLRHTWASMALAAGESTAWIANMLGHSTLETMFKHYARYIPNSTDGTKIGAFALVPA